jgi:hypothetical protein
MAARTRKILVMIPAGEIYDHDCVRWYKASDTQRSIEHYHNIGDAFVFDSSLKLLDYEQIDSLEISKCDSRKIDRFNSEYDYCFLRGSNYLNPSTNWSHAAEIIEKLTIPVIAFGIGAQAPSQGALEVSEDTKRVMRAIAQRCSTIGVRGAFTAQTLWDMGVKNIRVIGCPTLFRRNNPELRIDLPALADLRSVGFTVRREVSSAYAKDVQLYLSRHKTIITDLAGRYDIRLMAQGEIEEKKLVFGTPFQRAQALVQLTQSQWLTGADDPLLRLYCTRLFYSDVVADYDCVMRLQDLVLGYRLHGNLIALANGVPAIYFTYDSRTAEFAETFAIPSYDVFSNEPFALEAYWDQSRFEHFNRAYYRGYREMRTFLTENGLAHKMQADAPAAEARRAA